MMPELCGNRSTRSSAFARPTASFSVLDNDRFQADRDLAVGDRVRGSRKIAPLGCAGRRGLLGGAASSVVAGMGVVPRDLGLIARRSCKRASPDRSALRTLRGNAARKPIVELVVGNAGGVWCFVGVFKIAGKGWHSPGEP